MNRNKAYCISVELEDAREKLSGFWYLFVDCIKDALEAGVREDGELRAEVVLRRGIGASGREGDLLLAFFIDAHPRGLSQKQCSAISGALRRVNGWIEGVQVVPEDAVPVAMHVDGVCMRVAVPGQENEYVRWRVGFVRGALRLVGDPYDPNEEEDDFNVPTEPELPIAVLGGLPSAEAALPVSKSIVVVFDLEALREQWGALTWTVLEEHLVRLIETTMTPASMMLMRASLDEERRDLGVAFQYADLSRDFATALYEVFADCERSPVCVGAVATNDSLPLLFGGYEGRIRVFGEVVRGTPSLRQIHVDELGVRWSRVEVPSSSPLPFTLRRFTRRSDGPVSASIERTVEVDLLVKR